MLRAGASGVDKEVRDARWARAKGIARGPAPIPGRESGLRPIPSTAILWTRPRHRHGHDGGRADDLRRAVEGPRCLTEPEIATRRSAGRPWVATEATRCPRSF